MNRYQTLKIAIDDAEQHLKRCINHDRIYQENISYTWHHSTTDVLTVLSLAFLLGFTGHRLIQTGGFSYATFKLTVEFMQLLAPLQIFKD